MKTLETKKTKKEKRKEQKKLAKLKNVITPQTTERVQRLLKDTDLHWCLTASEEDIFNTFSEHRNKEADFIFIDNGAPVLCVAHIDTVTELSKTPRISKDGLLHANGLDDRLGLWQMLYGFQRKVDVLITTDEEIGASTAKNAQKLLDLTSRYNWVMEFDRSGNDVVTYDHENDEWLTALEEEFRVGMGTFSDITYLDEVPVCKVNVGHGVVNGHCEKISYAKIDVMFDNMEKMEKFYDKHANTKFEWDLTTPDFQYYGGQGNQVGHAGYWPEDFEEEDAYDVDDFDIDAVTGLPDIGTCFKSFRSFSYCLTSLSNAVYESHITYSQKYLIEEALSNYGIFVTEKEIIVPSNKHVHTGGTTDDV